MPQVLEQVNGLSVAEKREVLTYLIRHVTFAVRRDEKPGAVSRRIGMMTVKWHFPDEDSDRKMDEEIEQMFDNRFSAYGDFVIEA